MELLVTILILCLVAWLVFQIILPALPIADPFKTVIVVVLAVLFLIWLVRALGLL